jgi:uncharacterized protein YbaA (DUF1428 family)
MNNKTESAKEMETGNYVELFFYWVPKKNHDAMVQLDKQFTGVFAKHGGTGMEFFQLSNSKAMEGLDSIAKVLPVGEDEELWVELNYYKDQKHYDDTVAKLMKDESAAPLFKQFSDLITQKKSMIMGGFSRVRVL